MTIKHFEDLWNLCEEFHKNYNNSNEILFDEIILKINLYKKIDIENISIEEKEKIKSRLLGEILFTLTNLSLKDNINVFEALNICLKFRNK